MAKRNIDFNDPNLNLVPLDDGSMVSARVVDIIETIQEIWQGRIAVNWIPTRLLGPDQKQFCILEVLPDGSEHPVFWLQDEAEFTGEVLERLYLADNSKGDVLTRMDARNAALTALQKKVAKDQMGEASDIMLHAIRSPLNWYKLPNGTTIKDYGNRVK